MTNLIEVQVERLALGESTGEAPIVLLREKSGGRVLPIVIGFVEAQSILIALEKVVPPRPLTHDLIKNIVDTLNLKVDRVVINDLKNNTFYARIILKREGESVIYSIDARPSDSIAVALRCGAPIFVADFIFERAGEGNEPV